jgi:uncharacterized protein (TIGR03790 family)
MRPPTPEPRAAAAALGLLICACTPAGKGGAAGGDGDRPGSGRPDSGTPDSATPDSGRPDSGAPDSGRPDSGAPDSGDLGPGGPPRLHAPVHALTADDFAVIANADDPASIAAAEAWASARGLPPGRVLPLALGTSPSLSEADFAAAWAELDATFGDEVQGLALAFTVPDRVECMGATAAFALGFDRRWCQPGPPCNPTGASDYYDSPSVRPFTDHGLRPAMMLPPGDGADALIARGLASDHSEPDGDVFLINTADAARTVRWSDMRDVPGLFDADMGGLRVTLLDLPAGDDPAAPEASAGVFAMLTGAVRVEGIDRVPFLPGALADHLTSYGGVLATESGQMPATEWLDGGATASYGTAHEPCNYVQKFPRPSVLLPWSFRGASAAEAYWRSVQWPGEGNFVGDPLSTPFAGTRLGWADGLLTVESTAPGRYQDLVVEGAEHPDGPWTELHRDGAGRLLDRQVWALPAEAPELRVRFE